MNLFHYREKPKKQGRSPQKFMILDTETATLPFANEICRTVKQKQTVAIAKPLVYDIGWQIVDKSGFVYSRHSYLVTEIFSVPAVFDTAYYKEKRPKYLEMLKKGEISLLDWYSITDILLEDLARCDYVGAFNSMFDYKKAIPFTERYMTMLYSDRYYEWERKQKNNCIYMLSSKHKPKNEEWDGDNFHFRGVDYPIFDLWGIACEKLINNQTYKKKCLELSMITATGQFFKSSAETTFRHLVTEYDFIEQHMALDDALIETEIFLKAAKRGKLTMGLQYFPFQMLGKTTDFITSSKKVVPYGDVQNVIDVMVEKSSDYDVQSSFLSGLERDIMRLCRYQELKHGQTDYDLVERLSYNECIRELHRKVRQASNLKEYGDAWCRVQGEIRELKNKIKKFENSIDNL